VRGLVQLTAQHDLRPRGIVLHVFGEEVTTLGPNTLMTEYSRPFDLTFNLWLPSPQNDQLAQGEHEFPIEFVLPANVPPTFTGEFTHIVYLAEVKVDLPLHTDIRHEQTLVILPATLVKTAQPLQVVTSLPSAETLEIELTASGFYPGDQVNGHVIYHGPAITAATVELISREKAEAREFADHLDKVRVRVEIDPAQLSTGQPFPIALPIPDDVDPSFVGQHSSKERLVRATVTLADDQALVAEAIIQIGVR
jgi:hypothetical protein